MTRALAIYPAENTKGKRDSTGAFHPEALAFSRLHEGQLHAFDNTTSKRVRRLEVESTILESEGGLGILALFMHGSKRGIQSGHSSWDVDRLAQAIASVGANDIKVALYACDTGRDNDASRKDDSQPGPGGEGGFADKLRDSLVSLGFFGGWVDAHTVTAHTTKAPYVRRFFIDTKSVNDGGEWLISPGSPEWRAWRTALQEDRQFRLSFPLMTKTQIYMHLAAPAPKQ